MVTDNSVDLKLNLDFKGVNDALYQMIGQFNGTDKEFQKISKSIQENAKKLEASIMLFGPASQQAAAAQKALERNMVSLVSNGVKPEIAAIATLQQNFNSLNTTLSQTQGDINRTSTAFNNNASSIKQNNQKYTAFALILQDLPFGFRAIQNNLPALLGSFAGVGGAAYLAFSAIVAGFTFYDESLRKSAAAAKKLKEEQASLNDEILDSKQNALQQGYLLNQYVEIARNATLADNTRNEALKQANKIYGEHNEKLTLANINTKAVKESLDGYIQSLIQMAVAQKYSDQIASNIIKNDKIQSQIDKKKVQSTALMLEYTGKQTMASRDVVDVMYDRRVVEVDIDKLEKQKAANIAELTDLTNKYSTSLLKATELSAKFGKIEEPKKKEPKAVKDTYAKDFLEALKQEEKLFVDNLDNQLSYAEGNDQKKLQLLQKGMSDLVAWYNQGIIEESFYQNTLADLYKKTYNLKQDLLKKELDKEVEIGKLIIQNRENIADAIDKINQNMTSAEIKKIQDALKVRLKLDRNNINLQIKDYKDALKKLEEEKAKLEALGLPIQVAAVDKEIDEIKNKIESLGDTFQQTAQGISNIISGFLADSFVSLAENIGNALSGGDVKPLEHFQKLLAEALINIGKMLIQYGTMMQIAFAAPDPFVAIAAGVAAIALGTIIKNRLKQSAVEPTAFANGGIVSGPTMGLMGEYPGAQNNPEVIAPLDKLKDLIGGGGSGQFVLRGQDLVLAMQRSNSSLNIRRG
jgi:hypothetical protein